MVNLFLTTLNEINDNFLEEANSYSNKKKVVLVRWVAIAASICVILGAAIWAVTFFGNNAPMFGGLESVQNPAYDVVEFTVPDEYDTGDLHIVTTPELTEYDDFIRNNLKNVEIGNGIRVFEFSEGEQKKTQSVLYFETDGFKIQKIYIVTKNNNSFTMTSKSGDFVKAIEALSPMTTAQTPMYLAHDGELFYAVIDTKAYYLPDWTDLKPRVAVMPEINIKGLETTNIVVLQPQKEDSVSSEDISSPTTPESTPPVISNNNKPVVPDNSTVQKPEDVRKNVLPDLNAFIEDTNVYYKDIAELKDNTIVVVGYKTMGAEQYGLVRHFNYDASYINEYLFDEVYSIEGVIACDDGGFITSTKGEYELVKFNSNFELEWGYTFSWENDKNRVIYEIGRISELEPDCYFIQFKTVNTRNSKRTIGEFIVREEDIRDVEKATFVYHKEEECDIYATGGGIFLDGQGGFYRTIEVTPENIDKYEILKDKYDPAKGSEVGVVHYNKELEPDFGFVFGGTGDDKGGCLYFDDDGNYYMTVQTNWQGFDSFWDVGYGIAYSYRKMIVKFDKDGNLLFKTHITYGHNNTHIIFQKGENIYTVVSNMDKAFVICVDKITGKEIYRNQFEVAFGWRLEKGIYINSEMLVMPGRVSRDSKDYNVDFDGLYGTTAALFVYTYLE